MASRKEGTTLGPYRLIEQVGMGGMATVYKAYQANMDRMVAIKILPAHFAQDKKFVERFIREAKTIAKLEHKNILPVFDFGEQDGVTYLAMRYLSGGTLKDMLALGKLTLNDAVEIFAQIGEALDYAHRQGVIHRDIKPANIMVDSEGAAYLTDFGIAKVLEGSSGLTETGAAVGTPAYMAPEQSLGKQVDARSDIYALGVVLYEMVLGKPPYQADTPMAVALAHIHEPLPVPSLIDPSVPEPIEKVILKALAKNPDDRYNTAGDMVKALREAMTQTPTQAGQSTLRSLAAQAGEMVASQTMKVEGDIFAAPAPTAVSKPEKPARKGLPAWAWIAIAVVGLVAVIGLGLVIRRVIMNRQANATGQAGTQAADSGSGDQAATDPFLYDSFDDPANNGAFNPLLWQVNTDNTCAFVQQDGALMVGGDTKSTRQACWLPVGRPGSAKGLDLGAFEARMKIDDGVTGGVSNTAIYITTNLEDGRTWSAYCGLATSGGNPAIAYFDADRSPMPGPDGTEHATYNVPFGAWVTIRLEVDPASLSVRCFVDGTKFGEFTPPAGAAILPHDFYRIVVAARDPNSSATTWIDDVRIEPPAQAGSAPPPAGGGPVYDTFDDPAFNGAYNDKLWARDTESVCAFVQQDGALTVADTVAVGDSYCLMDVTNPPAWHTPGRLQAALQIKKEHASGYAEDTIRLGIYKSGGDWWYADCGIATDGESVWSLFWIRNTNAANVTIQQAEATGSAVFDDWQIAQIQYDPASGRVSCIMGEQLVGEGVPAHFAASAGGDFFISVSNWRDKGAAVFTMIEDVLIDPPAQ
jgi:tRNA A-37 threonylcarbamoyl transferase component Bud32